MTSCAPARATPVATAYPIWPTRPTPVTRATLPRRSGGTGDDLVDRRCAAPRECDPPVPAHDVHGALNPLVIVFERVVGARDRALRIGEQREIEAQLPHVTRVTLHAGGGSPRTPGSRLPGTWPSRRARRRVGGFSRACCSPDRRRARRVSSSARPPACTSCRRRQSRRTGVPWCRSPTGRSCVVLTVLRDGVARRCCSTLFELFQPFEGHVHVAQPGV